MKRGKDVRDSGAHPVDPGAPKEITILKFVMMEVAPGTFQMRFVSNDDLIRDIQAQGGLETFLADADELYADFRSRFATASVPHRPN
jgi:hypothetical protein